MLTDLIQIECLTGKVLRGRDVSEKANFKKAEHESALYIPHLKPKQTQLFPYVHRHVCACRCNRKDQNI